MAKPNMPDNTTQATASRRKRRTLRVWMWVIALLFAGTFFLTQCAMSKPQAKAAIIASCIKNGPFAQAWEQDLARHDLAGQSAKVIEPYCVCMWHDPLEAMSAEEIKAFSQMPPTEQLDKLGGEAAFGARHESCLQQQKPK